MAKFDSPVTEVLYRVSLDGTGETIGDVSTFGTIHHGLCRVTRDELETNYGDVLAEVGIHATAVLDGAFWIIHEDDHGFVYTSRFSTEAEYRTAMNALEQRWSQFAATESSGPRGAGEPER